jgi:MFS family permease
MITAIQQKQSYPWIYHLSCWLSLGFLLVFGSLFPLFCNALGMTKTQIGAMLSILPFSYLITIFISSWVARQGPKKIMLIFYAARYWFALLIPLAIWLSRRYGAQTAFVWTAVMVCLFAVCRSIAETGWGPWTMELIPSRIRGKFDALNSIAGNVGAAGASLAAVLIMKLWPGFTGYSVAICVGVFFGFIGTYTVWRLPGGGAQVVKRQDSALLADFKAAMQNIRLRTWFKGVFLLSAANAVFAFLPLFLSEKVGLSTDKIMLCSLCFQAGVLASAFFWGWSADRFGSKPIFLSTYTALCLIPISFVLLPRMNEQSLAITGGLYAIFGVLLQGAIAGSSRYFFVTVLPTAQNRIFSSSLNLALQSTVAAVCSLLFGRLLDMLQALKFDWRILHVDNFTVLFVLMLVCYIGFLLIFRRAPDDADVRTGQFVSFFLEGNPLLAFSSIVRYHMADDEGSRLEYTRRLGDSKSRLTVEEILQSADDPNYNVRYEAVISMARMPPDAKLINALARAVKSREPGVSEAACWALGRMGDRRALPVLREMLRCEYALLRSQCARALAKLNDADSVPEIISAFKNESNGNIGAGYAAALGRLHRKEALPDIVALLRSLTDDRLRGDAALAVARIIGGERHFVRLWKRSRSDFETACAEELFELEGKVFRLAAVTADCKRTIGECARRFEQRNRAAGAETIRAVIGLLPQEGVDPAIADLLKECAGQLQVHAGERGDYIILALSALRLGVAALIHQERKKRLLS